MQVILLGNEKGGSGKSTTAMHVSAGLMQMGYDVGALDLDLRQRSFTRYLENRSQWAEANNRPLPMPRLVPIAKATAETIEAAAAEEAERLEDALQTLSSCDFVVIDSPGSDTSLSRLGHAKADTIITPMNDSFVDFDLLARIDPDSQKVLGPSLYSEMVWEARKRRAIKTSRSIDWIVMRNRLTSLDAKNKRRVADRLEELSQRIGFRLAAGFGERVIYRELFPKGLTLLDLGEGVADFKMTMSHLAARQEVRALLAELKLPGLEDQAIAV